MTYNSDRWSFNKDNNCINTLIFITVIATICVAVIQPLFTNVFQINGPLEFFGLSRWGLNNYYIWQPVTSLFIQNSFDGIGLFFLLNLTFSMYMLYLFGSDIVSEYGSTSFLKLYFASGIIAGLLSLNFSWYNSIIAGSSPSILAIFTAWCILHKDSQLFMFFLIPLRANMLLAIVVAISLLSPLSKLDFATFMYYLSGIMAGYIYCTSARGLTSSFDILKNVDSFFIKLGKIIKEKSYLSFFRKKNSSKGDKIVDINTGNPVKSDDEFMDEMLAKISRLGEQSLTRLERDRMRVISEKKLKK